MPKQNFLRFSFLCLLLVSSTSHGQRFIPPAPAPITAMFGFSSASNDIVGNWTGKGILNVTFRKSRHSPVRTVSAIDEPLIFNADHSFARNGLSGTWKQRPDKLFEVRYDLTAYKLHLNDFWSNLGLSVSNTRIFKSKFLIQTVANGLYREEVLEYKMDVLENNGVKTVSVAINGTLMANSESSENEALSEFFPTLWQGGASSAASSVVTSITFTPAPIQFNVIQPTMETQTPSQ